VSLAEAQRRFQALVTAPSSVAAALAEASPDERRACEALLRDSPGSRGLAGLEIYANAYFARIRDVLAEYTPVLAAHLGEALFHDLVTAYLLAHPPSHASIRRVGDALPGFLAHPGAGLPFRRRAPAAPDLAALELARLDAFDAADAPVAGRASLASIPPERWAGLRLRFAPSLRRLWLDWPVERLWAAHQRGAPLPGIAPLSHAAIVWRRDERVLHRSLDALEDGCLVAALAGARFGGLCECIAATLGPGEAPARAAGLLAGWLDAGLVAGALAADSSG